MRGMHERQSLMSSSERPRVFSPSARMVTTTARSTAVNMPKMWAKPLVPPTSAATASGATMPPMRPMALAQPDLKARKRTGYSSGV